MTSRSVTPMMIRVSAIALPLLWALAGCKQVAPNPGPKVTAQGSAIVESSGGHQVGATGTALKDPLVVQVNDDQGAAVPGALVEFHGPSGSVSNLRRWSRIPVGKQQPQ